MSSTTPVEKTEAELSVAKLGLKVDAKTGKQIAVEEKTKSQNVTWTYYENGCVDIITVTDTDENGKVSVNRIKHYPDGRQPHRIDAP